jgi:hypothetical protein
MNEELLNNIWEVLSSDGATDSDFETWKQNFQEDEEIQVNVHKYLTEKQYTESDYETWSTNIGIKKKDNSQPTGGEEVMVSDTEVVDERGSSEPSVQINSEEEIVDPETLGEIEQIQEVPNRFGADTPKEEMFLHDDEIAIGVQPGEEDTAIEEIFGKNFLTDFLGDMWRAGAQGQAQGGTIDESLELLMKGGNASQNDIEEFLISYQAMQRAGVSDEMNSFNKIYQKDGGGILGFIKGVAANPTVVPQLFVSSVSAMINPTVLAAATAGAVAGSVIPIPGVGSIAGAMFAAGTTLETALTFGELLEEALDGEPMTNANIRSVLEDAEKMSSIRMKALGRGFAIGAIDGLTGGLATKLTTSVAKATSKAGKTVSRLTAATAGGTLEAVGGSTGEVVGRLVAGQEMDVAEILFEGVAGTATAPITVGAGLLNAARKPPSYEMNKGPATRADIIELLESNDADAILNAEVSVENDPELNKQVEAAKKKILDKKVLNRDLKNAGVTDQNAIDEMTALEEEAESLKGNNTRAGKRRLAEINQRIDDILDTPVVEQEVEDSIEVSDKVTPESERLAALEETLEGKDLEVLQLMRDKNKSQEMINNHIKNKAKNTGKGNQLSTKFKAEDTLLNPEGKSFAELVSAYSLIFEGKNLPAKTIQDVLADTPDLRDKNLGNNTALYPLQQAILNFESYQNKKNNQKTKQDVIAEMKALDNELGVVETELENTPLLQIKKRSKLKKKSDEISEKIDNLKIKQDAIQESSTESVDVQESTTDSQEVGDGNTQGNATQESIESEADTKTPAQEEVETTKSRPLKEKIKNIVDKIADAKNGVAKKWFNPLVMERAGITTDEQVKEYYIQSLENKEVINDSNKEFLNSEFKRLGIDPKLIQEATTTETVTENSDGTLSIPNPKTGKVAKLKGKKIGGTSNLYISDMISENIDPSYEGNTEAKTKQENYITKIAIKAAKSIAKLLPNTNIILHSTEASYNKGAGQASQIYTRKKGSRGVYKPSTNDIHINMTHANAKTIAHEIFHALLYNKFKSDERIGIVTYKMVQSIKKKITDPKLKKQLQKFSDMYAETPQFQDEEYLAELIGTLADNYKSLKRPEKTIVQKWLNKLKNIMGMEAEVIDTDADTLDLLATIAENIKEGKEITESDISQLDTFEQGEGGEVGVLNFSDKESKINPAPKAESDSRPFSSLVKNKDIQDFEGKSFVTNMYDFTTAGPVDLGNGITINLFGGKSYVPFMMERQGKNLGDVSNLAAFNSKDNAESFIRNSQEGNSTLFSPHSGTIEGSWQFQQAIFEQLVNTSLDNKILSKKDIIDTFNKAIKSKKGKKDFNQFKERLGKNIKNFNSFKSDPLEIVRLLDIENNFSPDLRKRLSNRFVSNDKFKKATGITSKTDFATRIMDPLNKGSEAFDLMSFIEFDNTTFEISKPKKEDVDYHPSFAWTVKAKIKGIYQPTNFQKSYDVTDSYVKYNIEGVSESTRDTKLEKEFDLALQGKKINDKGKVVKRSETDTGGVFFEGTYQNFQENTFIKSNVASSAGAIPKVAKVAAEKSQKVTFKIEKQRVYKDNASGVTFLTKGYGGTFINIPKKAVTIKDTDGLSQSQKPLVEVTMDRATYNRQDQARKVVDGKESFVNELETIRGFESVEREQKTTPDSIEGYNRMIKEVENIISKSEKRGVKFNDISKNVINYIQGSKVYEIATDIQREDIIRDVRAKFGIKEKAAPSVKNVIGKAMSVLFGETKEIKKFTVTEKQLLIQRLKQLNEGAKTAKKSFMKASKELADAVSEMVSIGKISTKQAAAVIKRFSKVNMFNEASIERFVDYMAKVFANAEYAEQIAFARKKVKQANKNIRTKLGIATDLINPLQRLFSIDPTLIPDSVFKKYLSLVEVFGERATVLTLEQKQETLKDVQDVLDKMYEEQSQAEEMALIFADSNNKVFNDDGKLNYAETIKAMLEDGEINEDSAAIMRKYKSDILPQVDTVEKTDEQIQEEKDEVIEEFDNIIMDSSTLPSQDERNLARRLNKLIDTVALDQLNLTQLKNLLKVVDNINNGYLPHYAQLLVEQMDSINSSEKLSEAIGKSKPLIISKFIAKVKTLLTKKRDAYLEMIRRNPLYNIDQLLGNFKGREIFDSLFSKVSEGVATYNSEYNKIQKKIEKSINDVSKSFKGNPAKILESSFKQMAYMIQLEFQSNPDSKQVNPASEYLKKTIKAIRDGKSALYTENDAQVLEKILKDFSDEDGNISLEKLDKSFNNAEKNSIKTVREVNEYLLPVAEYTSAIIRGDKINPLTNYIHLPVMNESKPIDVTADVVRSFGESLNPSTKAKSLIERTGKVSPINFNIYSSVQKGSKMVLMDRHLTEPIRTARRTLNRTESTLETENGGTIPVEQRKVFNAIKAAFLEATDNLLQNTFTETTIADDVVNYISKQGYRSVLAGTGRFMAELTSNIGFALMVNPKAFKTGINNRGFILSAEAPSVMQNVGSKQTGRIFSGDTLSGKMVDTNILNQSTGTENGRTRGIIANKIQQIYNLSLKKYINFVELTADALISTPDKLVMRPIWFGEFANVFKTETGAEVDFNKIAANDEAYMTEYSEAIEKAKDAADETSVKTGATDNPFMDLLKGKSKPNQTAFLRAFNNFNGFMTRFLIFEYVTARTGLYAAMGNGTITKKQGIATLAGVTTRMVTYILLTQMLGSGLIGLLFGSDEEEEKKSIGKQVGQAISSAFTSLLIGRDFGNAVKSLLNQGVEMFNEEHLDFLRDGDYDPYKDSIQYTIVPKKAKEDFRGTGIGDILLRLTGSFGPALKTVDLITKKSTEKVKKTPAARKRQVDEINQRIPLEVFGHLGLIPLYKDIRKVIMKKLYKDLRNSDKKVSKKSKSISKTYDSDMFDDSSGMFSD